MPGVGMRDAELPGGPCVSRRTHDREGDSRRSHVPEGRFAEPGRTEGGQPVKRWGAEQEPCSPLEVQATAAPGRFLERHPIITMRKGGDLAYGFTVMDLISCFRDIVDSEHGAENNGALQMV